MGSRMRGEDTGKMGEWDGSPHARGHGKGSGMGGSPHARGHGGRGWWSGVIEWAAIGQKRGEIHVTHFNRGATFTEEVQLPDDPLIDLLAQTNAKVEHFDLSSDGQKITYTSAESGVMTSGCATSTEGTTGGW